MNQELELIADQEKATEKSILFEITRKDGKGRPWQPVGRKTKKIVDALLMAKGMDAFEVAIFAGSEKREGVMYWSSKHPDVLNSTIFLDM